MEICIHFKDFFVESTQNTNNHRPNSNCKNNPLPKEKIMCSNSTDEIRDTVNLKMLSMYVLLYTHFCVCVCVCVSTLCLSIYLSVCLCFSVESVYQFVYTNNLLPVSSGCRLSSSSASCLLSTGELSSVSSGWHLTSIPVTSRATNTQT